MSRRSDQIQESETAFYYTTEVFLTRRELKEQRAGKKNNKKDTFVSAAMISTIGLIATRIISVIYIIPFTAMSTDDAMLINSYANTMFSQFYELSLAGLPLAISRLIAMYNARGEYKTSNRILTYAQWLLMGLGIALSLIFFFFAKPFASYQIEAQHVALIDDLVRTMRFIAPALMILPFMSGMRGYLQSFKTVLGVSISQVAERLFFVAMLLVAMWLCIYHLELPATTAISYAYIALPFASLLTVFVLWPFYRNVRKEHKSLMSVDRTKNHVATKTLFQQIISTALPFVIAGLASTMYMTITTLTYQKVRMWSGVAETLANIEYTALSFYTNKLVSIPLTFSLAMAASIISFVTSSYESGDLKETQNYVNKSYRMIIFTTLGAVILMVLLGRPLLVFFYQYNENTNYIAQILTFDGFRGMFFALETISVSLLQGLGKKNRAVLYSTLGPVVKLILTIPLVYFFGVYGEVFSVILGLSVVITLATREVIKLTGISVKMIFDTVVKTVLCIIPSIIYLLVANYFANLFLADFLTGRVGAFIYAATLGLTSIGIFLGIADFTGFLQVVFGENMSMKAIFRKLFRK